MTVTIGIDPHKRSHTAVAINGTNDVLGQLRVDADRRQVDRLLAFAVEWPERVWAVENANGLGHLLSRQLLEAGESVMDVPSKLSARVRALSGAGNKTDAHDALSTAIAGRNATALRPVIADDIPELLGLLVERRWQIVAARQKALVRIHEQLVHLVPGGVEKSLSATKTAKLLRKIRPSHPVAAQRRQMVKELLGDLRKLDRQRKEANVRIDQVLDDYGCQTLSGIVGIGRVSAAKLIAIVGDIGRFPTDAHFASFNGSAPIAASSGDTVRYRLNRGGHRQVNAALHIAAVTQARTAGHPGQAYVQRRMADGKTRAEAIRALKRHISNAIYRAMLQDAQRRSVRGGQFGR